MSVPIATQNLKPRIMNNPISHQWQDDHIGEAAKLPLTLPRGERCRNNRWGSSFPTAQTRTMHVLNRGNNRQK
ncbi:MAG: hypothetical protein ACYC4U_03915 [Pirellulaceae bacterium]